jgi:DTW domain-containing protein YfiP
MHPKEFQKTKNGTGYLTHRSLKNSIIYKGIDFTNHKEVNALIEDKNNNCFILYPSENSINLNTTSIQKQNRQNIIFILDSTWPCSRSMIKASKNLHALPKISFTYNKPSGFQFKTQPNDYCLSTIESTKCVLEYLTQHNIESLNKNQLDNFLNPFHKMVSYQIECEKNNC